MKQAILVLVAFMVTSCEYDKAIQRRARIRSEATYRLDSCLKYNSRNTCLSENKVFCKENKLEANCGIDGLWARPSNTYSVSPFSR